MKKFYILTRKTLLVIVLLLSAIVSRVQAQTITIGSGTGSNTTNTYPAPFGNYYCGARHQFLYHKSEIQAAGGLNGLITQFGFNVTATNGADPLKGYTVRIGQTASSALTTFQTGLTTVFTSTSYTPVVGWNMHTFSTPFPIDTSFNVIIEVCFSNGTYYDYSANASTQWTTGLPANTSIFNYYDYFGNGCGRTAVSSTASNNSTRPNGRFVITAATPMSYSTAFLTQNNALPLQAAKTNQEIMSIAVVTTGITSPLSITQFDLSATGTSNPADITRARIYSTGNSKVFDTTTLFGSITNPGSSGFSITGTKTLAADTNYFWLTYDISPSAIAGAVFDAEAYSVTVGGTSQFLPVSSVTGSRSILSPLSGVYQVGTGQVYARLENAITDIYYRGISGDVDLVLTNTSDTLYATLEILEFTNPSNNKVTIRPSTTGHIIGNIAGPLLRIRASNVVIDGSNSPFASTRNLTIENTNATGPQVLWFATSGTQVIRNCSVLNCNLINGAAISSAVVLQDIGAAAGGYYQNMLIKNNSIQRAYIGAFIYGAGTANMNIVVDSNDINATGLNQSRLVGIYMQAVIGGHIVKNNIGNFSNTNAETKAGIWLATGSQSIIIERNRISNIGVTGTNAGHGIRVSTGTTNANISVRNNIIDSIYGSGTSTFHSVANPAGITLSSAQSGVQVVYNTIKLSGNTLASSAANSAGIRVLTGSTVDVRNNYINNTLGLAAANGVGAYGITVETAASQFSAINTNNYYAGLTGTGVNAIGRIGATDYLTLAAWKGAVTADAGSVSENTPFVSSTDLHIPSSTSSQMEGAATVISGINGDYDLDLRSATTPDIGSDEFNGLPVDMTGPSIAYTPFSNNSATTVRTVNDISITDASGVNVFSGSTPRIYYKKPAHNNAFVGNSSSDNGWKYVESGSTSSPFSFNIDYSILLGGSVSVTDTIQYFIVAQDNSAGNNLGANPSVGFSGTSVSAITTAPTTPNFYVITPSPLSGPYQVGTGQAYTTLTAAVNDLNLRGVSAAVTLSLTDASYSAGETFPIVIKKIDGVSSTNTVTIQPASGITSTISGSTSSSIIRLEEARFVTINGSNNATNSRDLTIKNTGSGSVVHIASLGTTRGSRDVSIQNALISANTSSSATVYGVFIGSATLGSAGADNANIGIINDSIFYVGKGILAMGSTAISGINFSNNGIGNNTSNSVYSSGIEIENATAPVIFKNSIVNIKSTATALNGPVGIRLSTTSAATVTKNKVMGVAYTGTSGYGAKGIDLVTGNSNAIIDNNFVGDVFSDGDGESDPDMALYNNMGIAVRTGAGHSVRNNSVWMSGNRASNIYTDAISAGIYVGTGLTGLDIRNNLVLNTQTSANSSAGSNYAIYSATASSGFGSLNYNNYFVSSATGAVAVAIGNISGTSQITLANWRTATGAEGNSASDSIQFVSLSDLHLTGTSLGNTNFIATPIAAVTTDIDDEARHASFPYMGADENLTFPLPVDLLRFTASRKKETAVLNWATASETNNSHFIIERSADSRSFTAVGSLKGKGNSKVLTNYAFTDETAAEFGNAANGVVYYRLAQVDIDGNTSYSDIASVVFSKQASDIVVYPNPVATNLTVANLGSESGVVTIIITDIQGRELVNTSVEMSGPVTSQQIDMSTLEGGIYFVKTILNGKVSTHKVLRTN